MIWKKIIVKLRMLYADIRGHHGKRWDYEPSYWYMGRHKRNRFNLEKQFLNRHSADAYVSLMIEDREYDSIEYFLFEQSHDYQHKDESPMEDLQEVVNG
jgi:hypothetical protein